MTVVKRILLVYDHADNEGDSNSSKVYNAEDLMNERSDSQDGCKDNGNNNTNNSRDYDYSNHHHAEHY